MPPSPKAAHASGMNEIPAILRLADGAVLAIYSDRLGVRIAPDGSASAYDLNEAPAPGTGSQESAPAERRGDDSGSAMS